MQRAKLGFVLVTCLLIGFSIGVSLLHGASPPPYTRLISRTGANESGNNFSQNPRISLDGRFVVFESVADDLVANDTNGVMDVFIYDRPMELMRRVSVSSTGTEGNGESKSAAISPDGRYVVFESAANNLVSGDTNNLSDIFLFDTQTATTTRVNVGPGGVQATGGNSITPHVSNNATRIVYASAATNLIADDGNTYTDIFVYTRASQTTARVNVPNPPVTVPPNGNSSGPYITSDGRYVSFASSADNLVADDNNDLCGAFSCSDVFLRDLSAQQTIMVSRNSNAEQGLSNSYNGSVSDDGRYIAFESLANNLDTVISDTNDVQDIFLRDRTTGITLRISLDENDQEAIIASNNPRISHDGNWVVFNSGWFLVNSDTNGYDDIYRYSRASGALQVVSLPEGGGEANESSFVPDLSGDGQRVVFWSQADNLVPNDNNELRDVFVRTYLEDDATATPTFTPTNTGTPTSTPTSTNTPTPSLTPSITTTANGPPTLTPTGGAVTRTPTRTRTPWNGGDPVNFLPLIRRSP